MFQPDLENKIDLILLKICGTMARMGKDTDYMFSILDLDKGGTIDYHKFVDGIRLSLNIWVSQEEAEDLASYIDTNAKGQIDYYEWHSKVDFSEYSAMSEKSEYTVSKAEFL
jgi:Ca2+-binding EF-hand superfamily protein